jgi:hypothetical protein
MPLMEGLMGSTFFIAGIVFILVTRKRWRRDLVIPPNWQRWLMASGWLVFPLILYLVGFFIEKRAFPSQRGLAITILVFLGLWGISGFPTLFQGVLKVMKIRKMRISYARQHGLKFIDERVEKDFFPKSVTSLSQPVLSNILEAFRGVYIASAVMEKSGTIRYRGTRGTDIVFIEGIPEHGTLIASYRDTHATRNKQNGKKVDRFAEMAGVLSDSIIEVENSQYMVNFPRTLSALRSATIENAGTLKADAEKVRSILQLVARQGSNTLSQVRKLSIHKGRILLELADFLDTEKKLDTWIACAKKISDWTPP